MNKPVSSQARKKDVEKLRRPDPPADPPRTPDETPDGAVEGRDRLSENEDRRMDPGISDSAHS